MRKEVSFLKLRGQNHSITIKSLKLGFQYPKDIGNTLSTNVLMT